LTTKASGNKKAGTNHGTKQIRISEASSRNSSFDRQGCSEEHGRWDSVLDTSIIAYHAVKYKPKIPALTMSFRHGQPKDTEYVKKMVDFLHLQHEFHTFDREDVMASVEKIVQVLKIFDPMEIRNCVSVYIGLTIAKIEGIKSVFTGDGVDELFGYPWMWRLCETELTKKFNDMLGRNGFLVDSHGQIHRR
jgi:asparagine synthetase B (glutamine-hydrolysing)